MSRRRPPLDATFGTDIICPECKKEVTVTVDLSTWEGRKFAAALVDLLERLKVEGGTIRGDCTHHVQIESQKG